MLKKISWKLITICDPKKFTLCGDGVMVKNLIFQRGGEEFKSHTCNLGYLGYLGDLIK
jgi:hypothetical protein